VWRRIDKIDDYVNNNINNDINVNRDGDRNFNDIMANSS